MPTRSQAASLPSLRRCLGLGAEQTAGSSPGSLPGCWGALLLHWGGAFGLPKLGFLEEGLSHGLPFAGWKERGIRRTNAPSPSLEQELLPANQGKLEHPEGCRRRHGCGTPTCCLVPQGQPHHVAAQPVGKAVDPLVIEPVTCCLLQLAAGQGGSEGGQGDTLTPPSVLPQAKESTITVAHSAGDDAPGR